MDIIRDKHGKVSSKRVAGLICVILGIIVKLAVSWCSFFFKLADPITALSASDSLLYVGGALLGLGVFENPGAKKER